MAKDEESSAVNRVRQRMDLLGDITEDEMADVAREAWVHSRNAHTMLEKGKIRSFAGLTLPNKQRCVADFLSGVMTSRPFRERYVKACMMDPLQAMKIYVSTMPKEIEANVNVNQGVVILTAKAGSVGDWMQMARGEKIIDGDLVGEEGKTAAETWAKIMGPKEEAE